MSRKKPLPEDKPASPFNSAFTALAEKKAVLPEGPSPLSPASAPAPPKGPARAVVRYERKGRGGKEVTVVAQLALSATQRDVWLKALKQALGCGGALEGEELVLQGDQRARLKALLVSRGVQKVSVG